MTDIAYENAKARLATADSERAAMRARLAELDQEVARATRFISEWEEWAGINPGMAVEPFPTPKSLRVKNPPKEIVGDAIEKFLKDVGHPAARKRLMAVLTENALTLHGTDPDMVLSTMLWRMKDRFIRLPGVGYWIKALPYAPAGYSPGDAEKMEAANRSSALLFYPGSENS